MVSDGSHFDFIVVGGGTAGNVVAGRLAESANVPIQVVEAGVGNSHEVDEITTPALAMDLRGSKHDWAYKTTMVKRDDYERLRSQTLAARPWVAAHLSITSPGFRAVSQLSTGGQSMEAWNGLGIFCCPTFERVLHTMMTLNSTIQS